METSVLNMDLIQRFRGAVNNQWFALFKYRAYNDKNLWNCICSAMDWITVSVEHINSRKPNHTREMSSIEIYAFLASVDIIVEAVQQLHRVLLDPNEVVFKDDCEIFKDNRFGQTDLEYFKTLRSCFGAHPINLKDETAKGDKEKRRYASWSSTHKGDDIATVILYSNQVGGVDIVLDMRFSQVIDFAKKYYGYLENLIQELEQQKQAWFEEMRKQLIPKVPDPIDQLVILKEAVRKRIDNQWYESDIDELLLLFRASIASEKNKPLVDRYRKALEGLINNIHTHLQDMDFSDSGSDEFLCLQPKGLPNGWSYWYEKISSSVLGSGHDAWYWEDRIVEIFSAYFEPEYNTHEELYLLVNAALFDLVEKEKD